MLKSYQAQFKQMDDVGRGVSVFSTFNVIDAQGDITLPGAFGNQLVKLVGAHNQDIPNMGFAKIHESGNEALADFQFYLDMETAQEWYTSLKNNFANGVTQEWSYAFKVDKQSEVSREGRMVRVLEKMTVIEVSPVLVGAGVGTGTVTIKARKNAVRPHTTPTSDAAWDGPANEARVRSGESLDYYRSIYAWQDPDADATTKSAWRFIHHEINSDGDPGAANIRACVTGIGVLNGARGVDVSAQPWAKDRQGIWTHLADHLRDGEVTPPDLKNLEDIGKSVTLADQYDSATTDLADMREYVSRTQALAALRQKEGRVLSQINRDRLATLLKQLQDINANIEALLAETDTGKAGRLYAQFLQIQSRRGGA